MYYLIRIFIFTVFKNFVYKNKTLIMQKLSILPNEIYHRYKEKLSVNITNLLTKITNKTELTADNFNFYISLSSICSSKIEGEIMDIDSYLKYKTLNIKYKNELTRKIDDLYLAYEFAKNNILNYTNFLHAHSLITKQILPETERGKLRNTTMIVTDNNYKIAYIAANKDIVKQETDKLFDDIAILKNAELNFTEVFFFASLIHLLFVTIHPMTDGNGRIARLLEKWFLAEKIGEKAWFVRSESNYYKNLDQYYKNLKQIRKNYNNINYEKSIPFLLMLSNSLL